MLKPLAAALVLLLTMPVLAFAQWRPTPAPTTPRLGSTYDAQTGNAYNWNRSLDGSTNVNGLNSHTGSQWNSTIQPNGNQRGGADPMSGELRNALTRGKGANR